MSAIPIAAWRCGLAIGTLPSMVALAGAARRDSTRSRGSMTGAVAERAYHWSAASRIVRIPTSIARASTSGSLRTRAHAIHTRVIAWHLVLATHTEVTFLADAPTVVICQSSSGGTSSTAGISAGNLLFTVLAREAVSAMTLAITSCQGAEHRPVAAAGAFARLRVLTIVAHVGGIADATTIVPVVSKCSCGSAVPRARVRARICDFTSVPGIMLITETVAILLGECASRLTMFTTVQVAGDLNLTASSFIAIVAVAATIRLCKSTSCCTVATAGIGAGSLDLALGPLIVCPADAPAVVLWNGACGHAMPTAAIGAWKLGCALTPGPAGVAIAAAVEVGHKSSW